jgi:hypothetical protein
MAGQDYDKDLYIVLVGSGVTTMKNFVDNVEEYIFGPKELREATLLVPYTRELSRTMSEILNKWATIPNDEGDSNYPVRAFVEPEAGHASIAKALSTHQTSEHGVAMDSGAVEEAMNFLIDVQREGNEAVVIVIYDETKDVRLVGELKNYSTVPVLNVNGMIDSFPGFRTTDEILKEERLREEFETKEAIRIAAEKEQEKLEKAANAPAKKAVAPRKRAAAKVPEDKPLTESTPRKTAAPRKKAVAPKPAEPLEDHPGGLDEFKVGDKVVVGGIPFTKHSELPSELEPVKNLPAPDTQSATDTATVDVWADVARAQGSVDKHEVTHYAVQKKNLVALGEGIKAMSEAHAKTIDALLSIIEGK